jgi:hypothetical protein
MTIFELIGKISSKMRFLNPKKIIQGLGTEVLLKRTWKFLFIFYYTDVRQTRDAKRFKKFGFRKIPYGLLPKPLNKDIFSVFGIFTDDYLRNLTFWEKF